MTIAVQFAVSLIATVCFAVIYSAPKKELIFCGLTGAIGWIVYFLIQNRKLSQFLAILVAAAVLAVFSRSIAVFRRMPATVYLMPGIFPLVPGAGIYYTAYYLMSGEHDLCLNSGVSTLYSAAAIAFGILVGFAIPQKVFAAIRKK